MSNVTMDLLFPAITNIPRLGEIVTVRDLPYRVVAVRMRLPDEEERKAYPDVPDYALPELWTLDLEPALP